MLQVGEWVQAYNPKTHQMELERVLHVWINHDNDLVDLTLTSYVPTQHDKAVLKTSEVIHTNKKHPFLTEEKGFLSVGQMKLGMHLLRADGTYGVVTGWKVVPGTKVMYNLEVAQDHTFTVGDGQWVVHNCGSNLFSELKDAGIKFSQEKTVGITRALSDGQIVWLEQGNLERGLAHIIENHGSQFAGFGISEGEIPNLLMKTLSTQIPTEVVPDLVRGGGQRIFSTMLGDVEHNLSIVVGSNGFIVTAFPGP